MPQPMPPQGGPPAQGPGGQAPQQDQPQAQGGGGVMGMIVTMDKAIEHLAQVVASSPGAPPAMKQLIGQIAEAFGKFMEMVQGGGGQAEPDGDEAGSQGQTVPMEAGGNKNARPAM